MDASLPDAPPVAAPSETGRADRPLPGTRVWFVFFVLWMAGWAGLALLFFYGLFVRNQAMLIALLVPAGLFWALINVNSLPMVYDVGDESRIGAFTGLYYVASSIAAVAGPQGVGFLIDWSGGNYRIMFIFSAIFMLLAGILMLRVKEKLKVNQRI